MIEIGALEPALEGRTGYLHTFWDGAGEYYAPPVNLDQLTRLLRVNAHHESAIFCKRNTVMLGYRPNNALVVPRAAISAAVMDYIVYGNAYLRRRRKRRRATVAPGAPACAYDPPQKRSRSLLPSAP